VGGWHSEVGTLKADLTLIGSGSAVSQTDQADLAATEEATRSPVARSPVVQLFLIALLGLLAGYMFLGRGFAHVGLPPIYVGEIVLFIGLVAAAFAVVRYGLRISFSPLVVLLLVLMAWGAARTLPYLTTYGVDAMRDAVLWGYALFALIVYLLVDRGLLLQGVRIYGWVMPVFAVWVPISMWIFWQIPIGYDRLGSDVPLIFWKAPDMSVHITGSMAYLLFCTSLITTVRTFLWRSLISYPLVWAFLVNSSLSRGALLASWTGLGLAVLLGRSRNWAALAGGLAILLVVQSGLALAERVDMAVPPSPPATVAPQLTPVPGESPRPSVLPTTTPSPATPVPSSGPPTTFDQITENLISIFGGSSDAELTGTIAYRLAWWKTIVDYTVLGPYLWLGKGFGINLADDDGFQPVGDGSLRAPHNSHMTALARMGLPGFVIWMLFQVAFGIGLLAQTIRSRRAGDSTLAGIGSWILVYWVAIMVNTSFDPYLESPQGGIWFWTLIGLGFVVMGLKPAPREAAP
jgi:hypothetical protein